jgi:hypothetical protein
VLLFPPIHHEADSSAFTARAVVLETQSCDSPALWFSGIRAKYLDRESERDFRQREGVPEGSGRSGSLGF